MSKLSEIQRIIERRRKHPDTGGNGLVAYAAALVSGALLGGIALALLNRRTIQTLRNEIENSPSPPSSDDIY
jgi:hypothetical protein